MTDTFWIMEVKTKCRGCRGHGQSELPSGKCVWCDGEGQEWLGVHPTKGEIYCYETREEAARMLNICYPDQCREARLGGVPTVRITECTSSATSQDAGQMLRSDGTRVR